MKPLCLSLAAMALLLGGCTGPVIVGTDAAVIVATKGWGTPAADTADQIPPHESWCYSTMGDTECYAHIQDVPPHRLVNVDPANHYPIDPAAYHQALANDKQAMAANIPATGAPVALPAPASAPDIDVEKKSLNEELAAPMPVEVNSP